MTINLLQLNISIIILIIAVTVLRSTAIYNLPKKIFTILWGIIGLRLLFPFSIPSSFSLFDIFRAKAEGITNGSGVNVQAQVYRVLKSPIGAPVEDTGVTSISLLSVARVIWIAGMAVCALYFIITYFRCLREFKTSLPLKSPAVEQWAEHIGVGRQLEVRQSDRIESPLTYGILKPVILLPAGISLAKQQELEYILTHEYVHIKRYDSIKKILLAACLCVYWYNPFVWLFYILANRDIELSCDDKVIDLFGETKKSFYAMALLNMEEKKAKRHMPLFSNFSKNATEERIVTIMNRKKTSIAAAAAVLVLMLATTTAFALDSDKTKEPVAEETKDIVLEDTGSKETASEEDLIPGLVEDKGSTVAADIAEELIPDGIVTESYYGDESSIEFDGLDDIKEVTIEEFQEWMAKHAAELEKDVAEGTITREEADADILSDEEILASMKEGVKVYMSTKDEDIIVAVEIIETTEDGDFEAVEGDNVELLEEDVALEAVEEQ